MSKRLPDFLFNGRFEDQEVIYMLTASTAEDHLAELARIVGEGDGAGKKAADEIADAMTADPEWAQIPETSVPPLSIDLEEELSRAFVPVDEPGQEASVPSDTIAALDKLLGEQPAPVEPKPADPIDGIEAALAELNMTTTNTAAAETSTVEELLAVPVEPTPEPGLAEDDLPLMDIDDALAAEFDRALAEDIGSDPEIARLASEAQASIQQAVEDVPAPGPTFDAEQSIQNVVDSLEMPTLPSADPQSASLDGNDAFAQELDRLIQSDNSAVLADSTPDVPAPMQTETLSAYDEPELTTMPSFEPPTVAEETPVADDVDWQAPQMADYSDPAAEFQNYAGDQQAPAHVAPTSDPASEALAGIAAAGVAAAGAAAVSTHRQNELPQISDDFAIEDAIAEPVFEYNEPSEAESVSFAAEPQIDSFESYSDQSHVETDLYAPAAAPAYEKRQTGRKVAAGILAVALLGGTAAFAWSFFGSDEPESVKTLVASSEPVKVKPAEAGGAVIPNQDQSVFQTVDGNVSDAPKQTELKDETVKPINVGVATTAKVGERVVSNGDAGDASKPLPARKVRTMVVKPDGTIVSGGNVATAATTASETENSGTSSTIAAADPIKIAPTTVTTQPASTFGTSESVTNTLRTATTDASLPESVQNATVKTVKTTVTTAAVPKIDSDTALGTSSTEPKIGTPSPKPVKVAKVEPAKPVVTQPAAATPKPEVKPASGSLPKVASPYVVQISSQRSPAAARQSYGNLSRRYAGLLKGKGVDYRQIQINGRGTFYRVNIPSKTRGAANDLCAKLKASGGDCLVRRR